MNAVRPPRLADLVNGFEGAVPAVIATASADGTPNVTFLTSVRMVDDERVALSNQFFSKTARNLAANPRASVLIIDPTDYREFRLTLAYERTDRRGPVFDALEADVDLAAAIGGMQDVFRLRAADIYRVVAVEVVPSATFREPGLPAGVERGPAAAGTAGPLAALTDRLARARDLDAVLDAALAALADDFGHQHSVFMLRSEDGGHLYTIASHGYPAEGVGSEIAIGDGLLGVVAQRAAPVLVGNAAQMAKYSRTVRRAYEDSGAIGPGRQIPLPALARARSRLAVPAMALGALVGVLAVESEHTVAFGPADQAVLTVVAGALATAVELDRARDRAADPGPAAVAAGRPPDGVDGAETLVRFFPVDGSTFLDGDYLIKGVAGRILWSLLDHHARDGRTDFTNREVRLDPTLELPPHRDNFESRLVLLKRRLDERQAPIRIERTGRGRFRLHIRGSVRLETAGIVSASPPR